MPYTIEDFRRDYAREHLKDLTPEEILTAVPAKKLLTAIPAEELLAALSPEQRAILQQRLKSEEPPAAPGSEAKE